MADDGNSVPQLHPDDLRKVTTEVLAGVRDELRALFEATARGPAPNPPPGRPPADFDSLDARHFERIKQDVFRDVSDAMRRETSEFLPEEEINERIAGVTKTIDQRFDSFKSSFLNDVRGIVREENDKFRREFFELFEDIGLPLERGEGKRSKTQDHIRGMIAIVDGSKAFKSEIWSQLKAIIISWIFAGILFLAGYFGIKGGDHH